MSRFVKWGLVFTLLVVCLALGGLLGCRLLYRDRIYPGVFVAGIDLSGLDVDSAAARLREQLPSPDAQGLTLRAAEQAWRFSWTALGQGYEYAATADAALRVGREGPWFAQQSQCVRARFVPVDLQPVVVPANSEAVDAALQSIAASIALSPTDARLEVTADAVTAVPGQAGRSLDLEKSAERVAEALAEGRDALDLPVVVLPPRVAEPEPAYADAQILLAQPFTLVVDDPLTAYQAEFAAPPARVAGWLAPVAVHAGDESRLDLKIAAQAVEDWLQEVAPQVGEERLLDIPGTRARVVSALESGNIEASASVRHPEQQYWVQPGDAFFDIAYNHGFPQWRLEEANPEVDPGLLEVGQALVIPSIDVLFPEPLVPGKRIEISLPEQKMRAYESDELLFEFTISSGMSTTPTLAGQFQILMKEADAYARRWSLEMPYFMGIYKEGPEFYNGIHELPISAGGHRLWGGVLGWPASYGCIILDVEDAGTLFEWAPVGTLVRIEGVAPGTPFGRDATLEGLLEE